MATTQRPRRPGSQHKSRASFETGFGYFTLDPSPRLRRLREQQLSSDPGAAITQAGLTVRTAIATALGIARENR